MPGTPSYALYGLTIEIRAPGVGEETVADLLAPFPFVPLGPVPAVPDLRLRVEVAQDPLPVPPADARRCFGLQLFEAGGECYVCDDRSVFRTCPRTGSGHIALHPAFRDQPALARCNLFLLGFFPLLLARGFYDLHAAGVVRDGVGYLLIGESGSGKSNAALALAGQGWEYLSDDALLIRAGPDGVEALGFRRKFCLDPAMIRHWPELTQHLEEPLTPGQPKRFLDLERVYPGRLREGAVPRVLIFTRIVPEERTRLLPLDPTSALVRLLPQSASLAFNRRSARNHLELLRELVRQTRSYEWLAGRDVYHAPGRIADLLSEIEPMKPEHPVVSCATGRASAKGDR